MKVKVIPIVIGALRTIDKGLKGAGRVRNWKMSRDHSNDCIVEIGLKAEECHRDLRSLAVRLQ